MRLACLAVLRVFGLLALLARSDRASDAEILVLAGDPDTLASGFGGWLADARRARRGCLTGPQTLPEGDLIGARLSHGHTGRPPRPGRALLNTGDGTLVVIAVPAG